MTVEHRAAAGLNDIEIELADGGQGPALRLRRVVPDEAAPEPETPEQRIVQVLADAETPLSQRQVRERAATPHTTVGTILGKLVREGRVQRDGSGTYSIIGTGTKIRATPDDAPNSGRDPGALLFPVPASPRSYREPLSGTTPPSTPSRTPHLHRNNTSSNRPLAGSLP